MEKIEKKTERVVVDTQIIYKAIDGTEFTTEPECKRYEETAEAILLARVQDAIINAFPTDELFESSGEGDYKALVPRSQVHLDALNQLYKLFGGKNTENVLFNEKDLNTLVFMGYRFYGAKIEWLWFWKPADVVKICTNDKWTVTPVSG